MLVSVASAAKVQCKLRNNDSFSLTQRQIPILFYFDTKAPFLIFTDGKNKKKNNSC